MIFYIEQGRHNRCGIKSEPVRRAVSRFYRDLSMVLEPADEGTEKQNQERYAF